MTCSADQFRDVEAAQRALDAHLVARFVLPRVLDVFVPAILVKDVRARQLHRRLVHGWGVKIEVGFGVHFARISL